MSAISDKENTSAINKAYLAGYEAGIKRGQLEAVISKYTPNQIREILGLERINEPEFITKKLSKGDN